MNKPNNFSIIFKKYFFITIYNSVVYYNFEKKEKNKVTDSIK